MRLGLGKVQQTAGLQQHHPGQVLTSEGHRRPRTELFFWFDIGGMVLQQPGGHPVQLSVGLLEGRDGLRAGALVNDVVSSLFDRVLTK